jgi:hypothetical protein
VLFFAWELILWVELIISRNHIESPTDMIAVWLFIAQIVTMVLPGIFRLRGRHWTSISKLLLN